MADRGHLMEMESGSDGCGPWQCTQLQLLEAPPASVLTIPPPPVPPVLLSVSDNSSCLQCDWLGKQAVQYTEMPKHELRRSEHGWISVVVVTVLAAASVAVIAIALLMKLKSKKRKTPQAVMSEDKFGADDSRLPPAHGASIDGMSGKRPGSLWSSLNSDRPRYTVERARTNDRNKCSSDARLETVHLLPLRPSPPCIPRYSSASYRAHCIADDYQGCYSTDSDLKNTSDAELYFLEHFYEEPRPVVVGDLTDRITISTPGVYQSMHYTKSAGAHLYENPHQRYNASTLHGFSGRI